MKTKPINCFLLASFVAISVTNIFGQEGPLKYKGLTHETFYPETFAAKPDGTYFVVFEKAYFGKLKLELKSKKEQTIVIKIGEKSNDDETVDVTPPGTVRYFIDTVKLKKGKNTYISSIPEFEPPDWAKGLNHDIRLPESIGNLVPFRYLEITGFDGEIDEKMVQQIGYYYPFDDRASYCLTSSEDLNRLYDFCKHSIKATTYTGVYIDGDRERRPYEGDAYINQLSHYAVDAEYAICRKTIDHLFEYPTWPTEWEFHMHMILWEDYMYTGNSDYLKKYYHNLENIIKNVELDDNGLIKNKNNEDIIDWPQVERDGYEIKEVNNVPNAFYCNSMKLMSLIAGVLENHEDSVRYLHKYQKCRETFNEIFWSEDKGLYVDAIGSDHTSLHANIFPIAFGLSSKGQNQKMVPFIKSKGMAVSVYGAQYLLDALYMMGEDEYAMLLMVNDTERGWLNMIERGGTITWESWNEKVKGNLDWNHAWGAAPGNIIARRLFGIRPLEPGFEKVLIGPQFSGLNKGEYKQPTIKGDIEVAFVKSANSSIVFDIDSPMPVRLVVRVKDKMPETVKINGKKTIPKFQDGMIEIDIAKGGSKVEVFE